MHNIMRYYVEPMWRYESDCISTGLTMGPLHQNKNYAYIQLDCLNKLLDDIDWFFYEHLSASESSQKFLLFQTSLYFCT
jgi:hypothetical protein